MRPSPWAATAPAYQVSSPGWQERSPPTGSESTSPPSTRSLARTSSTCRSCSSTAPPTPLSRSDRARPSPRHYRDSSPSSRPAQDTSSPGTSTHNATTPPCADSSRHRPYTDEAADRLQLRLPDGRALGYAEY